MAKIDLDLDRAIGFHVNRVAYLMAEEVSRRFSALGYALTAQDFGILFRVFKQDGLTQMQIAKLMMRDKTTITRRLDGLVKKGFIARRMHEADRRHFCIHLTDYGRENIQSLMRVVGDFQNEVLADVPEADKQTTINTLQKITAKLIKE